MKINLLLNFYFLRGDIAMNKIALGLIIYLISSSVFSADKPPTPPPLSPTEKACKEGFSWSLLATLSGQPISEQYLILGAGGKSHRICNCSENASDDFYIELKARIKKESGEGFTNKTTRFHKQTCLFTSSDLVWIHNSDPIMPATGTIMRIDK